MAAKPRHKKIKTAVATFSIALGIGFVMQYGDAMASRWGEDRPVTGPSSLSDEDAGLTPVTAAIAVPQSMFIPSTSRPEIVLASSTAIPMEQDAPTFAALTAPAVDALPAPMEDPVVTVAAAQAPELTIDAPPAPIAAEPVCDQSLTVTPSGFAMVTVDYYAPCAPNATVTILHEDMMFEAVTDTQGALSMDVPALSEEALFGIEGANQETVFSMTAIPEIASYDRVVLQWQGRSDVQLHALEFGATYGDAGHIWAASAGDRVNAASGGSGFLTHLGNGNTTAGFFADVYTFPTGLSAKDGSIALSVEVEVTAMTCGRAIKAQTMQVNPSNRPTTQSLVMTMPGCDAIGDFLVLNNMFEDLTLASR